MDNYTIVKEKQAIKVFEAIKDKDKSKLPKANKRYYKGLNDMAEVIIDLHLDKMKVNGFLAILDSNEYCTNKNDEKIMKTLNLISRNK